jgi:hypothetical protein
LGSKVGMGAKGSQMGSFVGAKLSKLLGSGDYDVSESTNTNSLFPKSNMRETTALASFGNSGKDGVRVKHREYVQDIFAGTNNTFSLTTFSLNPGLSTTFPFLAAIANNFEEYQMHGLVFEFVTNTSPYSTVSNMGSIIMAAQYDAFNTAYTTKLQMENSDFAVSSIPHRNIMYGFECADHVQPYYYVRSGPSLQPINLTDIGLFYVGIQNTTAFTPGSTLGELWITYDVELKRPKLPQTPTSTYNFAHFSYAQLTASTSAFTPIYNDSNATSFKAYGLFGNATMSSSACTLIVPGFSIGDVLSIDLFVVLSSNSTLAVAAPTISTVGLTTTGVMASATGVFSADSTRYLGIVAGGSQHQAKYYYKVTSAANVNISFTFATLTTSAKYNFDIVVSYMGGNAFFS